MNPLLLVGGGAAIAYLIVRARDASAATTPRADAQLARWGRPASIAPPPAGSAAGSSSSLPPVPTRPPQITIPAPPATGEVAPSKPGAPVVLTGRWGWPVPRYDGRAPVISDGFGSPRPPGKHMGVDLMFGRISTDPYPVGANGSKAFVMPDAWMAVAASDGVLWSAGHSPRGYSVVVDHGSVATFYQHLEVLFVPHAERPATGTPREKMFPIRAGQPLGVIGGDPLNPPHLKHLHFELWSGGWANAIDPAPLMKTWQLFSPGDVVPFLNQLHRNAARMTTTEDRSELVSVRSCDPPDPAPRNASLNYREIGKGGESYPAWVRALRGKSGVYVIRERQRDGSTVVVYVGESHAHRLYQTLTRHFQTWRRHKRFWAGQYTGSQSHDPGLTYDRGRCTVAVRVLPAERAIDEEARLIARLRPRDNLIGQPAELDVEEFVPF